MVRAAAFLMAASLAATAGAAELPTRAKRAKSAEPERAQHCEVDGRRGFLTDGGICVIVGGFVQAGVSVGPTK